MGQGTPTGFPGIARDQPLSFVIDEVNRIRIGRINATIDITLTANATTTTLTDPRLSAKSYVDFMPQTANAATAKANIYVTGRKKGSCTLNHSSSANTDQTFTCLIIG